MLMSNSSSSLRPTTAPCNLQHPHWIAPNVTMPAEKPPQHLKSVPRDRNSLGVGGLRPCLVFRTSSLFKPTALKALTTQPHVFDRTSFSQRTASSRPPAQPWGHCRSPDLSNTLCVPVVSHAQEKLPCRGQRAAKKGRRRSWKKTAQVSSLQSLPSYYSWKHHCLFLDLSLVGSAYLSWTTLLILAKLVNVSKRKQQTRVSQGETTNSSSNIVN